MNKKALVLIDIQNDITKHYRDIIDNINAAIDWAVDLGIRRCRSMVCQRKRPLRLPVGRLSALRRSKGRAGKNSKAALRIFDVSSVCKICHEKEISKRMMGHPMGML